MTPTELAHAQWGPAAFVFEPSQPQKSVPAFGRTFKALAWACLLGLGAWMLAHASATHARSMAGTWALLAWFMMAATVWGITRSTTTFSRTQLLQTGLWDKSMPLAELAYARLIRWPWLDALIAPRLYVRSLSGKFTVIYCADAAMLADMKRLCTELSAFRAMR